MLDIYLPVTCLIDYSWLPILCAPKACRDLAKTLRSQLAILEKLSFAKLHKS